MPHFTEDARPGLSPVPERGLRGGQAMTAATALTLSWSRVFQARADQVREARAFLRAALEGCTAADDAVSRPGEFHPRPLAEPAVHVSAQRAPIAQRSGGYAEFPLREQPGIAARDGTQPRSCCAFPAP